MHTTINDKGLQIIAILDDALGLKGRSKYWRQQTRLYNNLPELDCFTAVNFIVAVQDIFNINLCYEDFNAEVFATVNSLVEFIDCKKQALLLEIIN